MNDIIKRQGAIDALGEEPEVWSGKDEYEQGLNNQWNYDVNALKALPSIDAETVIRCKDCKWWDRDEDDSDGRKGCDLLDIRFEPEFWCAYGERIEDGKG